MVPLGIRDPTSSQATSRVAQRSFLSQKPRRSVASQNSGTIQLLAGRDRPAAEVVANAVWEPEVLDMGKEFPRDAPQGRIVELMNEVPREVKWMLALAGVHPVRH